MNKRLPNMNSDQDVENLLDQDLSDYLNADNFSPVTFEQFNKNESIKLDISSELLNAVKEASKQKGMNEQAFITEAIEQALKLG
ncbi:CopG family antitoxin [Cyanothece sp. BG0011]|uniref:CopG family antitoxin n=1 Tax=Cyanothece sp. BG0011 TaxID=2082950 RepID=UPI000D1DCAC8|nr:CopG family antitoxin [Cyanothece sp. BG0011]